MARQGIITELSCVLYFLWQIRVKHMISQGVVEQSPFSNGYNRINTANSGRILETNTDNLLRMVLYWFKWCFLKFQLLKMVWKSFQLFQVSYCENDVDCRRLLQLVHFGEKFDSNNCRKTCDNCLKIKNFVEKDVTEIAKQLVWILSICPFQLLWWFALISYELRVLYCSYLNVEFLLRRLSWWSRQGSSFLQLTY